MSNGRRVIYVGLTAVIGLLLVALAAPRVVAGLLLVPYGGVPGALAENPTAASDREVQLAALGRARSLEWHGTASAARDLAALRLTQAVRTSEDAAFDAAVAAALEAAERSLALAPSQPTVWYGLAYARLLRDGTAAAVDAPLRRSLQTGSYDPRLMLPRIDLALATWPALSEQSRALVLRQFAIAYVRQPGETVAVVQRRRAVATALEALAPHPALSTRFAIDYGSAIRRD